MKIISSDRSQLGGYKDIIYTKLSLVGGAMQQLLYLGHPLSWHFWQPQFSKHAEKL